MRTTLTAVLFLRVLLAYIPSAMAGIFCVWAFFMGKSKYHLKTLIGMHLFAIFAFSLVFALQFFTSRPIWDDLTEYLLLGTILTVQYFWLYLKGGGSTLESTSWTILLMNIGEGLLAFGIYYFLRFLF